jgi:PAB-dependent poly(A)-specific ribonuclease subunit 3
LYPLEGDRSNAKDASGNLITGFFKYRSWSYKAGSELDGKCYVLRRLEGDTLV